MQTQTEAGLVIKEVFISLGEGKEEGQECRGGIERFLQGHRAVLVMDSVGRAERHAPVAWCGGSMRSEILP